MPAFIISGTDTNVGKTVASALLVHALHATYWKPIQSGLSDETDSEFVQRVTKCTPDRILPERYQLTQPLSPHVSAELDEKTISLADFSIPHVTSSLIIEGAGGLLVPINWNQLQIDLFQQFNLPIVLISRTTLGTINHTLLSIEILKQKNMAIHSIILNGPENKNNRKSIEHFGHIPVSGWIPEIKESFSTNLFSHIFSTSFDHTLWT